MSRRITGSLAARCLWAAGNIYQSKTLTLPLSRPTGEGTARGLRLKIRRVVEQKPVVDLPQGAV